jgi:hypothetical protein
MWYNIIFQSTHLGQVNMKAFVDFVTIASVVILIIMMLGVGVIYVKHVSLTSSSVEYSEYQNQLK